MTAGTFTDICSRAVPAIKYTSRKDSSMTKREPLFETDLDRGHAKELEVAIVFVKHGWVVEWDQSQGSKGDIKLCPPRCRSRHMRTEVKNEDDKYHTRNICLEMSQGDPPRPSGLLVSESEIWIHGFREVAAVYHLSAMLAFIAETEATVRGHAKHGIRYVGDNHNGCYVWPRAWFLGKSWYEEVPFDDIPKCGILLGGPLPPPQPQHALVGAES